jgi:hypothetical protein
VSGGKLRGHLGGSASFLDVDVAFWTQWMLGGCPGSEEFTLTQSKYSST